MTGTRPPRALITGVSGQDGAYLAQLLVDKGYQVVGTCRNASTSDFSNLVRLGIKERLNLRTLQLESYEDVQLFIRESSFDEIYHLAGESSVASSFHNPREVILGTQAAVLNILESIRTLDADTKLFFAGSSECFGDTGGRAADESTPFRPLSPYGVAKAAAFDAVKNYRDAYGLRSCTGILFNHESPLRPQRFVTQKVVASACRIASGSQELLELGDLTVQRDWGWAPEYVEAMWRMLQHADMDDYVLATGDTEPLTAFVDLAFRSVGLKWEEHTRSTQAHRRPTDIPVSKANPQKAMSKLGWKASLHMDGVVKKLIEACQYEGADLV